MSITAIDAANVSMVHFRIPKSAFVVYEAGEESLGVNLENLKKILKQISNSHLSFLSMVKQNPDYS